jgi:4-amino-4-deoxy-L-arabinose transferase-like glycosyltransferase
MLTYLLRKDSIYWIIIINLLARLTVAASTTLSNDEVYYVLYARYLDWSYYDHPPLVGWLIWLTTFGLSGLDHELLVRLGSLVLGTVNLWLVYRLGILIKDRLTGVVAALMLTASFYSSVIVGTAIIPDTPQSVFWLLAIFFFVRYIRDDHRRGSRLLLFGVCAGLAMLSKYHAVYLWVGALLYFVVYERTIIKRPALWGALAVTAVLFLPVVLWNLTSDYSGVGYHANRVGSDAWLPSIKYLPAEFFGQIAYHNPANAYLIGLGLVLLYRRRKELVSPVIGFLLATGVPLVLTTLAMSLYNRTLPHWSGPAYFSLTLVAAYALTSVEAVRIGKRLPRGLVTGQVLFFLALAAALVQVYTGRLVGNPNQEAHRLGRDNFAVDISLWDDIGAALQAELAKDSASGAESVLLTYNWFPAAHLDYYYAYAHRLKLYALGAPNNQHQYQRINALRGSIPRGATAYYITTSHYHKPPNEALLGRFARTSEPQIITIDKQGQAAVNVFVWKLNSLQEAWQP